MSGLDAALGTSPMETPDRLSTDNTIGTNVGAFLAGSGADRITATVPKVTKPANSVTPVNAPVKGQSMPPSVQRAWVGIISNKIQRGVSVNQ